jgi:hypothetical protein
VRVAGRKTNATYGSANICWRHHLRFVDSEIAARHALPTDVIEGVTERTGGVPLFVEEVTRLLLERGEQGGVQAIPPTLQQSFTARLDRRRRARWRRSAP